MLQNGDIYTQPCVGLRNGARRLASDGLLTAVFNRLFTLALEADDFRYRFDLLVNQRGYFSAVDMS